MILFSLRCAKNHGFDSWFASGAAYDSLRAAGMVTCPNCGDGAIEKALMTPRVSTAEAQQATPRPMALSGPPGDPAHAALAELRRIIEANSEDVGNNFVAEARAIHDGDKPARSIYGQARPDEARKLVEDGVPIAPLPFLPKSKTN